MRGGLQIELRLNGDGICECDVAALESVARAVKGGLTFENVHPAEDGRAGNGATQAQVGVTGEAGDCGPHLKFGGGLNVDIKLNVIQRRVRCCRGRELATALEISAEVKAGRYRNLIDTDIARNRRSRATAYPMQLSIGGRTDARRVTQANILARRSQIEVELFIEVGCVALQVELAPAGAGAKGFDVHVVAGELKRAIELVQSAGQSCISNRSIVHLKRSLRQRICKSAADGYIH